jgi:hypothetical protein
MIANNDDDYILKEEILNESIVLLSQEKYLILKRYDKGQSAKSLLEITNSNQSK